ncbi:MAG TPA: YbfB/YjiJ family MFS transporter [Acetobacteraceae bacterium]|jgi:MFS family permease|nr:YbfB/YjiJ family MFS transporter [Acetobacteraceae bacterium]
MSASSEGIYLGAPPTTRVRSGMAVALGGMVALAAGMGIGRFVYTPILPDMARALGLTASAAGLIASANFLGYLAGAVLVTIPHLPGGRRNWFLAGLAASAASTAVMALPSTIPAFLLLRFIGGTASAFVLIVGSALVLDHLAALERSHRAAVHFAGVGVGIAISSLLVDVLQAAHADWRWLWLASGAVSACTVPLAAWLMPKPAATPEARHHHAAQHHRRLPRGIGTLTLCHGLFGFGYVVTATFLVAIVRSTLHAPGLEAVTWLLVGVTAAPSTAVWGRIGSRIGAVRAYALACLLEAVGVAAGGLWVSAAGVMLAAVLLGATFMGITALGFTAARALAPHQQHRCFAVITAGFGLGQIVGPSVAGLLLDRTHNFAEPSLLAAAAVAAAAILTFRVRGADLNRPRRATGP